MPCSCCVSIQVPMYNYAGAFAKACPTQNSPGCPACNQAADTWVRRRLNQPVVPLQVPRHKQQFTNHLCRSYSFRAATPDVTDSNASVPGDLFSAYKNFHATNETSSASKS
ncbi:hypothetical protein JTE90_000160 [Oedothorax gibbosus]|uniref:Uncharacterized protein n=1 Tax=Oedothorax gibbosus TaxID=931172 RepID=A0AAV6TFT6_9ARAC|nr:hypothetical protein JTE90_000160 [Oedothorax gibbosus]